MKDRLALLLSTVAIILALLGSTPVAGAVKALVLPPNSVGTSQLRANAVTSAKLHNGSVAAVDIQKSAVATTHVKDGSLLAADFRAGQLPAGPKGDPGPTRVVFRRAQTSLSTAGIASAIAHCGPTEKLTGGGAGLLRAGDTISGDTSVNLVASYPGVEGRPLAEGEAATQWTAIALAATPSSTRLVAFAACATP